MSAERGLRSSFARAALTTYGTNFAVAVLSLVNVLIVARALGPEGRGDVAFAITVAVLSSSLAAFGVQEANANLAGTDPTLQARLASNSVVLALLLGAAAAGAVATLVAIVPASGGDVRRILLWTALLAIPPMILKAYLTLLVQADYSFSVTNAAWLLGPLTTAIANATLALAGALSVGTAIVAWVGGQVLGAALLLVFVWRRSGFAVPDPPLARRAVGFGAKTHVGRSMALGNYRLDQWLVGSIAGSRELGLYSIAVAWAEVLFYLPGVLVMVQRPDLVRASRRKAGALAARVFRVGVVLALALAAVLVVAAPVLCTFVFGESFRGAADDLRVLALAAFGISALELLGSALTAQRKPMLTTGAVGAAFVATVSLDLLLIPPLGGLGAAIATAAAWTLGGIVIAGVFSRALDTPVSALVPRADDVPRLLRRLHALARRPAGEAA